MCMTKSAIRNNIEKKSNKRKIGTKDTYQRKEDKAEGRRTRLRGSPSSTSSNIVKCKSCGNFGHATAASKACKNHIKNQDGILQEKLGNNFQRYTRKIKFETVLRDEYKTKFTEKIVTLSAFLKEVIIKAQFFVNYCLIDNKELYNHKDIFQKNFWYSICQLIMKIPVTNKTYISQSFVLAFASFSESHPSIFCSLKEKKLKGTVMPYLTTVIR